MSEDSCKSGNPSANGLDAIIVKNSLAKIKNKLVVMSGKGGDIIIAEARRVLNEEYPEAAAMELHLPDEKIRRVGQSVAAASLPAIG